MKKEIPKKILGTLEILANSKDTGVLASDLSRLGYINSALYFVSEEMAYKDRSEKETKYFLTKKGEKTYKECLNATINKANLSSKDCGYIDYVRNKEHSTSVNEH